MTRVVFAIFVGGRSSRMGEPKGSLIVPETGKTILHTLVERGRAAGFDPVFVGDSTPYAGVHRDVPRLADDPRDAGPLGGLHAVLMYAAPDPVIAVACDMPHVEPSVLALLCEHATESPVLAARRGQDAPWEPMLARYASDEVLPAVRNALKAGVRSFQALFAGLSVEPLPLEPGVIAALQDWDTPDDVER